MRNGLGALVVSLLAAGSTVLMALGCSGDETTGPSDQTGAVQVSAATVGTDLDVDGYAVSVDGGAARNIAHNGLTTFSGVSAGAHQVELTGVADNCSVTSANPVSASVTSGNTAQVAFEIQCDAPAGFIQVSTSTSGEDLDPDGFTATLDGSADRSIGLNGVTTFSEVAVGSHQVELTGIADNCSVSGSNPATAPVASGETAQVSFDVECEALPIGSLTVTTTVTNNFDPDGFQVLVDGMSRGVVDVNGSATFDDLPAGAQQVELTGIAPNCEVDGDDPATVTIPIGGTATADFSITCASPPDGRIVHVSTGGASSIAFVNADGSGLLRIWDCPSNCWYPTVSADGRWIAFDANHIGGARSIYVMEVDGSSIQRLTTGSTNLMAAWSPDGSTLAVSQDRGAQANDLWLVEVQSGELTQLTDSGEFGDDFPTWSPVDSRIAFSRHCQIGAGDCPSAGIHMINADGTGLTQITEPGPFLEGCSMEWWDDDPDWHPDGSRILFRRLHCSAAGIDRRPLMVVAPDGSSLQEIADGMEYNLWPSWSPDGLQILVEDGNWDLYSMNADGSNIQKVTGSATYSDWGP